MKVFVTGATGFIGSAIVRELLARAIKSSASHARILAPNLSSPPARKYIREIWRISKVCAAKHGVIYTAFVHDCSKFKENCEIDRRAIEARGKIRTKGRLAWQSDAKQRNHSTRPNNGGS